MHVVLRSSRATGSWSLRRKANENASANIICQTAVRLGIVLYRMAITESHIHLLLRAREREALQKFLRVVAGQIAQRVTGARRGRPCEGGFWDSLVFSRLVTWGREFGCVSRYVEQNLLETKGLIPFRPRRGHVRNPGQGLAGCRQNC